MGTSPQAIARLDAAIAQAMQEPETIRKLHVGGCRVTYLNPADFKARIGAETAMFGSIIAKGNIKVQ